jgi:hypothetical protein
MTDSPPTVRTTLAARYVRLLVWCRACRHQADADPWGRRQMAQPPPRMIKVSKTDRMLNLVPEPGDDRGTLPESR